MTKAQCINNGQSALNMIGDDLLRGSISVEEYNKKAEVIQLRVQNCIWNSSGMAAQNPNVKPNIYNSNINNQKPVTMTKADCKAALDLAMNAISIDLANNVIDRATAKIRSDAAQNNASQCLATATGMAAQNPSANPNTPGVFRPDVFRPDVSGNPNSFVSDIGSTVNKGYSTTTPIRNGQYTTRTPQGVQVTYTFRNGVMVGKTTGKSTY